VKLDEIKNLDSDEEQALLHYLKDSFWYNLSLRSRAKQPLSDVQAQRIGVLDKAFLKAPPCGAMTLYRAIGRNVIEMNEWVVGSTFVDKGYVSTSSVKSLVNNPGYVHPEDRVVVTIAVPAGITIIDVYDTVRQMESAPAKAKALAESEKEFLLPRNLEFKITSLSHKAMSVKVLK